MKSSKPTHPSKQDVIRQKKIEENVKNEKLDLSHPKGKERFKRVLGQVYKKDKSSS